MDHSSSPIDTHLEKSYAKLHPQSWRRARWQKIWYMAGSLVVGVGLAVGHDLFYRYLAGKRVDAILSQTWVTNIGTAFAFLLRMFLVISAGIAFVQLQWKNMKTQSFEVEEVDNMSGMLEDIFSLLHARLWLKVPTLTIVAIITWLIPVAAVFPPGTLRVAFLPSAQTQDEQVAQIAFTNNSNWNTWVGTIANYAYSDAGPVVYRAALAAGTSGEVLSIPHNHQNVSYSTKFFGPAIQCNNASDELTNVAVSHINITGSGGGYFYASFVAGDDHQLFNTSGFTCSDSGTCGRSYNDLAQSEFQSLDSMSTDAAKLYVMLGRNLTECKLYNATYDVSFNFTGVYQSTKVNNLELHNTVVANMSQESCGQGGYWVTRCLDYSTQVAYQSIMEAYGSLFVGALTGHFSAYQRYQTVVETLSIAPNWSSYSVPDFQDGMVELFQNVTLSMLNFPTLRQHSSTADFVPSTVTTYPAVYDYQPLRLWIAYGVSIVLTIMCAIAGLFAIKSNGASYSNKFSTFVRTTKNTNVYNLVSGADDGANPCPDDLKRTRVTQNISVQDEEYDHAIQLIGVAR